MYNTEAWNKLHNYNRHVYVRRKRVEDFSLRDETIVDSIFDEVQDDLVWVSQSFSRCSELYNLSEEDGLKLVVEVGARLIRYGWIDFGYPIDLDRELSTPRFNVNEYAQYMKEDFSLRKIQDMLICFLPTLKTPIIIYEPGECSSNDENDDMPIPAVPADVTFEEALNIEIQAMKKYYV